MSDLTVPVDKDGNLLIGESSTQTEKKKGTSELGKEDFLLLLVTQMQYQDPLNPQDDTDFVAQLAQFSSLEQMQNLNATTINSQAFTLVGKEVIIKTEDSTGKAHEVQGTVDYVTMQNGKAYLSVDGSLYSIDDLKTVVDDIYAITQYLPAVQQTALEYHHQGAKDQVVEINLGSNGYQATALVVQILNPSGEATVVPNDKLSYKDGKLTISKDAFATLEPGKYTLVFAFNDPNSTIDGSSVTLTVKGKVEQVEPPEETTPSDGDTDGDDSTE